MLNIVSIFFSKASNKVDAKRNACLETLQKIKAGNNDILLFLLEYVYSTVNSQVLQSIFHLKFSLKSRKSINKLTYLSRLSIRFCIEAN